MATTGDVAAARPLTEPDQPAHEQPTPARIMQLGTAFLGAKALLSAVELGLFTELAAGPLDAEALRARLGLHSRSARDFFDALVALGMLEREDGRYRNTPETDLFLDRAKPAYIGGILEMFNARLYPFWAALTEGLRTGRRRTRPRPAATSSRRSTRSRPPGPVPARHDRPEPGDGPGAGPAVPLGEAPDGHRRRRRRRLPAGAAALAHPHLGGGFDLPGGRVNLEEYVAAPGSASG